MTAVPKPLPPPAPTPPTSETPKVFQDDQKLRDQSRVGGVFVLWFFGFFFSIGQSFLQVYF